MDDLTLAGMKEQFERLCRAGPALTAGAVPLGIGDYSLIIDHQDGTVSKAFFYSPDPLTQQQNQSAFSNEARVLCLLNGEPLNNVHIPKLVEPARRIDNSPDFFGIFRMTKLAGHSVNWETIGQTETPERVKAHFHQAGQLMADFHARTQSLKDVSLPPQGPSWSHVQESPYLNEENNLILRKAGAYFKKYAKPAILHNDFHGSQLMRDDKGKIIGLLDFGYVCKSKNHLGELRWINMLCPEFMDTAMAGYEQQSGQKIDSVMMRITGCIAAVIGVNTVMKGGNPNPHNQDWLNASSAYLEKTLPALKSDLGL